MRIGRCWAAVVVVSTPLGIILGSELPLIVLAAAFLVAFTALVMLLVKRGKHRREAAAKAAAALEKEEAAKEQPDEDLVKSEREATWSGESRYRNEPGHYYGEAVKKVVRVLILTDEEKEERKELQKMVTRIIHEAFPGSSATSAPEGSGASVSQYGSGASKLCIQGRNLDLYLRIVEDVGSEEFVAKTLCNALWEEDMEDVTVRTRGGRQIVRFLEPASGITVDVGINVHNARLASSLLREYGSISKRALQLIVVVKHWADRREVCTSYAGGTLNSYAYTLMVISFLQRRRLPVVPVLPCDQMGCSKSRAASFGASRSGFLEAAKVNEAAHEAMRERIGQLLIAFFDFYGNEFDSKRTVISVRTGELLRRTSDRSQPMVIEDPLEPDWNVAACVDSHGLSRVRKECRRAKRILTETPASKKLWNRFLSPPLSSMSSSSELPFVDPESEHICDCGDCHECQDCSECAQLTRP
mmetsp:Transcript_737/g.2647  ORF Transcript_737/g.2647 Transcript_737/m.2647 type:complete len:472 (+) Transcript_737:127-1542(+)